MRHSSLLLILFLLLPRNSFSQDIRLYKQIPVPARYMTVDELGNIYVVRTDNTLLRYNENGDSTGFYRSVLNGEISFVDATNPLRVMVYYPGYFKIVILDRMLSQKNELDLRKINIANATAIASSADGNMWVYDRFNARLKKIDDQLNEIKQSNDLRQEIQTVPSPLFMTERNWNVYLSDATRGIFVFDRYANYLNTIPILNAGQLQVSGSKILYRKEDSLYSWDIELVKETVIRIPRENNSIIINAAVVRNRMYVLSSNVLNIYDLSEN